MGTSQYVTARTDRYRPMVLALGVGHGFSDAAAGYLVGWLSAKTSFAELSVVILLYNVLAFGGQLPAGVWLDRIGQYRTSVGLSLLSMGVALILLTSEIFRLAVLLAGCNWVSFGLGWLGWI